MQVRTLLLSFLLAGCATGPVAMLEGTRSFPDDPYNYDVEIVAIDGKAYLTERPAERPQRVIDPGPHVIVLRTTKPRGIRDIGGPTTGGPRGKNVGKKWAEKTIMLTAEPCVRYILSAQHSKDQAQLHWEPRVREEPVAGCETE